MSRHFRHTYSSRISDKFKKFIQRLCELCCLYSIRMIVVKRVRACVEEPQKVRLVWRAVLSCRSFFSVKGGFVGEWKRGAEPSMAVGEVEDHEE